MHARAALPFPESLQPAAIRAGVLVHTAQNIVVGGLAAKPQRLRFLAKGIGRLLFRLPLKSGAAKLGSLPRRPVGLVDFADRLPIEIPGPVKTPMARNEDHGAVGRGIDADLQQQGLVALEAVELPAVAERIDENLKSLKEGVKRIEDALSTTNERIIQHITDGSKERT